MRNDSNTTLIALYEAWNKPEKTEEWRAKLPKQKQWKSDITDEKSHLPEAKKHLDFRVTLYLHFDTINIKFDDK